MEVFNISRLQEFQNCEQKYAHRFVSNLAPKWDGVPRPLGSAYHEFVGALYKGKKKADAGELARTSYWKEIPLDWKERGEKVERDVIKGQTQLEYLIAEYPWKVEPIEDVISVEKELTWEVEEGVALRFRVDLLVRQNGLLWMRDTKTTSDDVVKVARQHRLRNQYVGYAAGVEEVLGEKLAGVMLDFAKKPRVNFKKVGAEISSVSKDLEGRACGFHREPIHKTPEQLEEFRVWFHKLRIGVWDATYQKSFLKNSDHCGAYNRTCPFLDLCLRPDWGAGLKELYDVREADYVDREGGEED